MRSAVFRLLRQKTISVVISAGAGISLLALLSFASWYSQLGPKGSARLSRCHRRGSAAHIHTRSPSLAPGPQSRGGRESDMVSPAPWSWRFRLAAQRPRRPAVPVKIIFHDRSFNFLTLLPGLPADDGAGHPQAIDSGTCNAARISTYLAAGYNPASWRILKIFFRFSHRAAAGTEVSRPVRMASGRCNPQFSLVSPPDRPRGVSWPVRSATRRGPQRRRPSHGVGWTRPMFNRPASKSSGCSPPGRILSAGTPHRPGLQLRWKRWQPRTVAEVFAAHAGHHGPRWHSCRCRRGKLMPLVDASFSLAEATHLAARTHGAMPTPLSFSTCCES